jgi:hypothetical protein
MGFGQHFQEIIPEQAGLTFVMDFLELHAANISKTGAGYEANQ